MDELVKPCALHIGFGTYILHIMYGWQIGSCLFSVKVCLQVIMYINFAIVWALFNVDRQWNALQIIIITQNLFNIIV